MDVGCLVQNVGTALAVYNAVIERKPLIERVLTVTGEGIKEPKNLLVRIGTPVKDIIEYCGGLNENSGRIIFGGPMMGLPLYTDTVPVIKGTSGILILPEEKTIWQETKECIRCAKCVDGCPMFLVPAEIYKFVRAGNFDLAEDWNVMNCIECGTCAYDCPSRIDLVHYFKYAKSEIIIKRRKEKQLDKI